MNIFAKITGRTMRRNKARTIVTIIGVILATAMITAILVLGISVQKFMLRNAIENSGDWHIYEQVASEKDAENLTKNPEVKE